MDCETFDTALLDLLYDELDETTAAAMEAHATGHPPCAEKLAKLRATRRTLAPMLTEPLPSGIEDRILAAATAVMPAPRGKVIAFLARPQLAMAATLLLLVGGAFVVVSGSASKETSAPASRAADQAPAAQAVPLAPAPPLAIASAAPAEEQADAAITVATKKAKAAGPVKAATKPAATKPATTILE